MSIERVAAEAMQHELVQRVIDEQLGNFGAPDAAEVSDYVRARFEDFAYSVGLLALEGSVTPIQQDEQWRARFRVEIDEILDEGTPLDEFIESAGVASWYDSAMTEELPRLQGHSFTNLAFLKIADCMTQVAQVIDQGLDPDILVLSREQQYLQLSDLSYYIENHHPDKVVRLITDSDDPAGDVVSALGAEGQSLDQISAGVSNGWRDILRSAGVSPDTNTSEKAGNDSDDPTGDAPKELVGLAAALGVDQVTPGIADGLQDLIRYGVVTPEADSGE